jgi:Ca2+-binding EF-hand superfamily protein
MKKTVLTLGFLTLALVATDFSSMTTEELINLRGTVAVEDRADFRAEMQSRVSTMTAEEQASFQSSRQAQRATPPTFSDMDKDNDGKITQSELDTARADRMAERSADGKLLQNAGNAPTLASIDTNGDGSIDATEFASHQTTQMENHSSQQGQGGAGQQLQDGSGAGSMGGQGAGMGRGMGQGMGHNR